MYTEELKINETSVEELNLIADPSGIEMEETGNNASEHSSSLASTPGEHPEMKFVDQEAVAFEDIGTKWQRIKSHAEEADILVCEDTPSSRNFDNEPAMVFRSEDPSPASQFPHITMTSQDFDEHVVQSQAKQTQNIAPMFNPSNKQSFASNRESFINSR